MTMNLMKLIVVFCLSISGDVATAQVEVWRSQDSCDWFFSRPSLRIPNLSSDMSLETMISWIVVDSLCRIASDEILWERLQTVPINSFRVGLKYLYKLMDFDPLLFIQYQFDCMNAGLHLKNTPNSLLFAWVRAYQQRFGNVNDVVKLMLASSYILHVQVVGKSSRMTTDYSRIPPILADVYCADLFVIDNMKGKRLYPRCEYLSEPPTTVKEKSGNRTTDNCKSIYWGRPHHESDANIEDSLFYQKYGPDFMSVGSEYIVFIGLHPRNSNRRPVNGWKSDAIVFNFTSSSGNSPLEAMNTKFGSTPLVFPVVGGLVIDADNFFGYGTTVPVMAFKQKLNDLISNFIGN